MDMDHNDGTMNMDSDGKMNTDGGGAMDMGNNDGDMTEMNMETTDTTTTTNDHQHDMTMNHNMHTHTDDKTTNNSNMNNHNMNNHNMDMTDPTNHNNHNVELETFLNGNDKPFCVSSGSHLLHGGSGGMIMYMDGFRWSLADNSPCLNLFFPGWTLDTSGKFAGAVLGVLALAVVTEGVSKVRYVIQRRFRQARRTSRRSPLQHRCAIASLHTLQALLGYVLMLVTMTFSLELLFTVILGLGVGYFLFFSEDDQHVTTNPCCSFMQNEADELEHVDDGSVEQSTTTGDCCEPQKEDHHTASPNNSQYSSIADSTLVDVENKGEDKNP
mmetsp:Transcript_13917/g.21704  ORF Transcript_13917/g.21704 Transcript_13917/m.21704 type:complete len:327 (-) Transcript_13917:67-1047(-)|eukprot:CAMPEP_0195291928 /NCGR_PEP_ID=MMETSP0707-20130614/8514_1 /TAXON_ID=33640 /ORGANISM="Asterionellopsis glacialis, Strain CCMP134" /LENGTH=326 /DNA_ID=CAMNT_0040352289 /DNA_START=56 /DNA_END=1036 /DNA_ORIENTATION=-